MEWLEGAVVIPVCALRDSTDDDKGKASRETLKAADLVFLRDVDTEHTTLAFGREFLQRIVDSGVSAPAPERVVIISLDMDTNELEWCLAAVQVLKGHHDYVSGDGSYRDKPRKG